MLLLPLLVVERIFVLDVLALLGLRILEEILTRGFWSCCELFLRVFVACGVAVADFCCRGGFRGGEGG